MSPVEHDCGHPCCPDRFENRHEHYHRPEACPECNELRKAAERPSPEAKALKAKAERVARLRPDRNTRRDP